MGILDRNVSTFCGCSSLEQGFKIIACLGIVGGGLVFVTALMLPIILLVYMVLEGYYPSICLGVFFAFAVPYAIAIGKSLYYK